MPGSTKQNKALIDEPTVQLVISHIKDQDFAAYIHQVSEVLRYTKVTPIPNCPPFIAGVASLHGEMAVIIDLQRYFSLSNLPNEHAKHILVIQHGKELYGLLVDEVTQIIRVPESSIRSAPGLIQQINNDYISGVYTESEVSIIMVFNLEKIFSEEKLMMIGEAKQKHLQDSPTTQEK